MDTSCNKYASSATGKCTDMGLGVTISAEKRGAIFALRCRGLSIRVIKDEVGVSVAGIQYTLYTIKPNVKSQDFAQSRASAGERSIEYRQSSNSHSG